MSEQRGICTHTYTQRGIILSYKKEILPLVATEVNLEGIMLSETGQTEKNKYYVISLYMGKNE